MPFSDRGSLGGDEKSYTGLIIAIALLIFLGIPGCMAASAYNYAVTSESDIEANRDQAKNVLGQYRPTLAEAIGVTSLQTQAVENVITGANESRYGAEGARANQLWIREQNPNLDQASYGRILNIIEAGRRDFRNAQEEQLDRIRQYRTGSQTFPRSAFLGLFNKPTPGFFKEYNRIVVSGHANEAFQTGIDDGVDVKNLQ